MNNNNTIGFKKWPITIVSIAISIAMMSVSSISYAAGSTKGNPGGIGLSTLAPEEPATAATAKENDETFSVTLDATSNYIFRGISQSNNDPAGQFNIIYNLPFGGIYVNAWGSNVDFIGSSLGRGTTSNNNNKAWFEWSPSIGISNNITKDFSYDLSFNRYTYPDTTALDYNEVIAILKYKFLYGTIGYSDDVFATGDDGAYYNIGVKYPIAKQYFQLDGLNILGSVGYYDLHQSGNSYSDYMLGISKTFYDDLSFIVQWTDTNGGLHAAPFDGSKVVATISYDF